MSSAGCDPFACPFCNFVPRRRTRSDANRHQRMCKERASCVQITRIPGFKIGNCFRVGPASSEPPAEDDEVTASTVTATGIKILFGKRKSFRMFQRRGRLPLRFNLTQQTPFVSPPPLHEDTGEDAPVSDRAVMEEDMLCPARRSSPPPSVAFFGWGLAPPPPPVPLVLPAVSFFGFE